MKSIIWNIAIAVDIWLNREAYIESTQKSGFVVDGGIRNKDIYRVFRQ